MLDWFPTYFICFHMFWLIDCVALAVLLLAGSISSIILCVDWLYVSLACWLGVCDDVGSWRNVIVFAFVGLTLTSSVSRLISLIFHLLSCVLIDWVSLLSVFHWFLSYFISCLIFWLIVSLSWVFAWCAMVWGFEELWLRLLSMDCHSLTVFLDCILFIFHLFSYVFINDFISRECLLFAQWCGVVSVESCDCVCLMDWRSPALFLDWFLRIFSLLFCVLIDCVSVPCVVAWCAMVWESKSLWLCLLSIDLRSLAFCSVESCSNFFSYLMFDCLRLSPSCVCLLCDGGRRVIVFAIDGLTLVWSFCSCFSRIRFLLFCFLFCAKLSCFHHYWIIFSSSLAFAAILLYFSKHWICSS